MIQAQADDKGGFTIIVTFVIAILMSAIPFPDFIAVFKPDWVAMVLVYWVMAVPNRVGVFSAAILGIFLDVLEGSLLGVNVLSLAVVAFLIQILYHRLRLFPRWKQAVNVAVIIGIHRLIVFLLMGLVENINGSFSYWLPLLSTVILWPWVFIVLRDVRRKFC